MTTNMLKTVWPEWEIEEKPLGKGSFGEVYKAVRKDHNVESYAAIKVISIPADPSEIDSLRSEGLDMNATRTYLQGIVNDFVAEIQMMESLKGVQNIVSVEDYKVVERTEELGWDIYIRMELLTPFNNYICDKKLTEEEVIKLGCDICSALEICSKRNIIHRDIKPENIFINDFGHFKLGDFGIARKMENMTGGLSQKGTFNYMAPEVATSNEYDARVDTYSLGIVLYRLLNGNRLPFLDTEKQLLNPNERRNAVDRRIHGEALPAPCDASAAMADVILRACAFNPDKRFASAADMKKALMSVANGTYQVAAAADEMDKTTSVRKAAADYDKTTSVRKAPADNDKTIAARKAAAPNQQPKQAVNTFGNKQKKKKGPKIIAAIVAAAILVVGILVTVKVILPQQEIKEILADAKVLADEGNYTDAIEELECGLEEFPGEKKLKNKIKEYQKALVDQEIATVLTEAEALAAEGKYKEAASAIQTGLEDYPDSETLNGKFAEYTQAHEDQQIGAIVAEAEAYAEAGNFKSALNEVKSGLAIYPDSQKLISKRDEYAMLLENQEITTIITEAQKLAAAGDYRSALNKVNAGLAAYPNSTTLQEMARENAANLAAQVKEETLKEAAELAEYGDYNAAIAVIQNAMQEYPNDADYIAAYEYYVAESLNKKTLNIPAIKDNVITVGGVFVGETQKIAEEATVTYKGSLTQEKEQITYSFKAPRDGRYGFEVQELNASESVRITVVDSSGNSLLNQTSTTSYVDMKAGETYEIRVRQNTGYPTYTLQLYIQKPTVDLSNTSTVYDQTAFYNQKNIYIFTAPTSGKYHFDLSEYKNGVGFRMMMWDKYENNIMDTYYEYASVTLEAGETYEFQIRQDSGLGSFKLSIGFQKETVDLTGVTVVYDSIEFDDQRNVYTFTAPTSGKYHFDLSEYKNGVGFRMMMWDKYENNIMDTYYEYASVTLEAGETYELQIRQDAGAHSYKLSIGYQKEAVNITGYDTVNDSIVFEDQKNVYLFTPSTTGEYTFSLSNYSSDCSFKLMAWDNYEYLIMETSGSSKTLTLEAGVTYEIQVRQSKGMGSYTLSVEKEQ